MVTDRVHDAVESLIDEAAHGKIRQAIPFLHLLRREGFRGRDTVSQLLNPAS